MDHGAEWRRVGDFLVDGNVEFADLHALDAEGWPPVSQRRQEKYFTRRRDFAQAEELRAEMAEVTACLDGVLVASLHSGDGERLDRVNTISGPIFARKSNALLTEIRRCVRRHRSRSPATDQPAPHRLRVRKKASLNASTAGRFGCASQYASA